MHITSRQKEESRESGNIAVEPSRSRRYHYTLPSLRTISCALTAVPRLHSSRAASRRRTRALTASSKAWKASCARRAHDVSRCPRECLPELLTHVWFWRANSGPPLPKLLEGMRDEMGSATAQDLDHARSIVASESNLARYVRSQGSLCPPLEQEFGRLCAAASSADT